ncbi:hypothetical protein IIB79_08120 [candidate division KSB1 bacterium]|nr:hypothetical protein [candidate division KSB1 bacterium]
MKKHHISLGFKTEDARLATAFQTKTVNFSELETTLKSHNYSLISWKIDPEKHENEYNRRRKSDNFESASGIVVDIDDGLSIAEARQRLETAKLNYALITSKSHQKDKKDKGPEDRFHILVFFNKVTTSAEKYKSAFGKMRALFPEMDESVKDLARFIFSSPEDAEFYSFLDGEYLDIDSLVENSYLEGYTKPNTERKIWEFDLNLEVMLSDGKLVKVAEIDEKHPIFCPREEHTDDNPSAFVQYIEDRDKFMILCSGCGWMGWSKTTLFEYSLNMKMENFYFCGKDILEMGVSDEHFFATKLCQDAFNYLVDASGKEQQQQHSNISLKTGD